MAGIRPHLYLDCDGVLADFDAGVRTLLGMSAAKFEAKRGRSEFWKRLARDDNFCGDLAEMPDAQELFAAVKHLKPTILTGIPLGTWAAPQKERWAAEHFPDVPIITTLARQKHLHMDPGDVLVDDRDKHRKLWEDAGGIFIHHKNAADTIRQLAEIYASVKAPADA